MFKIVNNERLSDNMFRVTFEAPLVARKAQPGQFLMFRVDEFGNLWCSSEVGVIVYAADGTELGRILVPETVSNVCFGGRNGHRLFMTATTSLYAVSLAVRGATRP